MSTSDMTKARVKAARKQIAGSKNYKDEKIAEAEHIREHLEDHH